MDELVLDTQFWREKAKKTRDEADRHFEGGAKHKMLVRVALEYEKLARQKEPAVAAEQPQQSRSVP